MAFKQAILTRTSFAYTPYSACNHKYLKIKSWKVKQSYMNDETKVKMYHTGATSSGCKPRHNSFNAGPMEP
jgi:hypothetical protein